VGMTFNGASSILNLNAATMSSFAASAGSSNPGGLSVGASGDGTHPLNMEAQELLQFNTAHTAGLLAEDSAAMRAAWRF
jgi:hypothetical protein